MNETYWRWLGELRGLASFREQSEREFPEGASELPEGVSRREMLMLLGASLSLAGLGRVPPAGRDDRPVRQRARGDHPGHPAPLRDHDAVRPQRLRPGRRKPRRAADQDRRERAAPPTAGRVERAGSRPRSSACTIPTARRRCSRRARPSTWADFVAAWGELDKKHARRRRGGAGDPDASRSRRRRARGSSPRSSARFPRARVRRLRAGRDENVLAGIKAATGDRCSRSLHLDKARRDPRARRRLPRNDPEDVAPHRAASPRAGAPAIDGGPMNRLYVVEAGYSLTGAMADHRLRLAVRLDGAVRRRAGARSARGRLGMPRPVPATFPASTPRGSTRSRRTCMANRGNESDRGGARAAGRGPRRRAGAERWRSETSARRSRYHDRSPTPRSLARRAGLDRSSPR